MKLVGNFLPEYYAILNTILKAEFFDRNRHFKVHQITFSVSDLCICACSCVWPSLYQDIWKINISKVFFKFQSNLHHKNIMHEICYKELNIWPIYNRDTQRNFNGMRSVDEISSAFLLFLMISIVLS